VPETRTDRRALIHQSYLFAPGANERVMVKALTAGADAVVLDLEDSVPASKKDAARRSVARIVAERGQNGPPVHVRINRVGDDYSTPDLNAVVRRGLEAVRIPKAEGADAIAAASERVGKLEREHGLAEGSVRFYPTIESALGLVNAGPIARASARVEALVFGEADFAADVGLPELTSFLPTLMARSTLVTESRAARIGRPVDGAFTRLDDLAGLTVHTERVKQLGFGGKSAIHPSQLPVIHEVFQPTARELKEAEAILAASSGGDGITVVDGRFVDPAIVAYAARIVAFANRPKRENRSE